MLAQGMTAMKCDVLGMKRGEVCVWCPRVPQCDDWRDGRRQRTNRDFRSKLRERAR